MKVFLEKLKTELFIAMGLSFISAIVYFRFIVKRLPKELSFYQNFDLNFKIIYITISSFTISLIIVISCIRILLNIELKKNIITMFLIKINEYVEQAYRAVLLIPRRYFGYNIYDDASSFASKFHTYFSNYRKDLFLIISFGVRFIILLVFLYDVFISFKLELFYKTIPLVFIILSIKVIFFILKNYAENYDKLIEYFIVEEFSDGLLFTLVENKREDDFDMDYALEELQNCVAIKSYLDQYEKISEYYQPRLLLFIYSVYFMSWLYIFYQNIISL